MHWLSSPTSLHLFVLLFTSLSHVQSDSFEFSRPVFISALLRKRRTCGGWKCFSISNHVHVLYSAFQTWYQKPSWYYKGRKQIPWLLQSLAVLQSHWSSHLCFDIKFIEIWVELYVGLSCVELACSPCLHGFLPSVQDMHLGDKPTGIPTFGWLSICLPQIGWSGHLSRRDTASCWDGASQHVDACLINGD